MNTIFTDNSEINWDLPFGVGGGCERAHLSLQNETIFQSMDSSVLRRREQRWKYVYILFLGIFDDEFLALCTIIFMSNDIACPLETLYKPLILNKSTIALLP